MALHIISSVTLSILLLLSTLSFTVSDAVSSPLAESFANCSELNSYYIDYVLKRVGPYGLTSRNAYTRTRRPPDDSANVTRPGGPSGIRLKRPFRDPKRTQFTNITDDVMDPSADEPPGGQPVDVTNTNVQIRGVDEPDIIKSNGFLVYTISGNTFTVVKILSNGTSGRVVGQLNLPDYPAEMLFYENFVVVLGYTYSYRRPVYTRYKVDPSFGETALVLYQIRVSNFTKPVIVSRLYLEGEYVASREVTGTVRIVMRFNPLASIWLYFPYGSITTAQTKKWNEEIISYSNAGNWLPTYLLQLKNQRQYGAYVSCKELIRTKTVFAGFNMVTVVTIPLNALMVPRTSAAIMSDADKVYSTKFKLYVTTSEFRFGDLSNSDERWGANYKTQIHQFRVSRWGAKYIASGQVTGSVIDQFALSEYNNILYIATTDGATWWTNRNLTESKITAFRTYPATRRMWVVGTVGNLGVGERIYAVRFRRITAYVVTFRETDPLYIIDIRNPRRMKLVGELKISGYSSYLHPVAPGRLLGVGQEATRTGRVLGTKVALFDVSVQAKPKELATWTLSGSYSNVEWDHRAFLFYRKLGIAIMPVNVFYFKRQFYGAVVLKISATNITELGRVTHTLSDKRYSPSILRNAIVGNGNLWSMSYDLLQINNLFNLSDIRARIEIG